jgi:two-component system chemotaxis response regulator CheB
VNETNGNSVSVLVADDSAIIRKAIRGVLEEEPAIKILGEAVNFEETISMAVTLKPDVVLLDLHMPDNNKFEPEFVKNQLSLCGSRVLAMSLPGDGDEGSIEIAEGFGAIVMLDKAKLHRELIPAIFSQK